MTKQRVKVTVHDNYVTLRIDDVKFIVKNPRVQPFCEYIYNGSHSIMYFYYDWVMYRKNEQGWRKVHTASVYEFGVMQYLEEYTQALLDIDCRNQGVRYYFNERQPDGTVVKSKTEFQASYPHDIAGMFDEDVFQFTKHYKTFEDCRGLMEFEFYDLAVFIGGDECGKSAFGARFTKLSREDVEQIKVFAHEFMEITNRITKAQVEARMNDDRDSEYNEPKIVRDYLKEKYGITDWRPIFEKICVSDYVLEEYIAYIKGELDVDDLQCNEWHGEKRKMPQLLQVMPDYEAYMYIIDDNRNQ